MARYRIQSVSHTVSQQMDKGMFQVIEFPNLGPIPLCVEAHFKCHIVPTRPNNKDLAKNYKIPSARAEGRPTTLMKS